MISYLKGSILEKTQKSVIVLAGDIGYEVFLSAKDWQALEKNSPVEFFVYSYIKEDTFDLYGFKTTGALDFFKKLISVSGVGPKSAINVLGLAEIEELKRAITTGDPDFLRQVSGIGKKTAERIVVELKEKFIDELSSIAGSTGSNRQVVEALVSLGYKEREAQEMVKNLPVDNDDLAGKIKRALQAGQK
ncbi:MAG: Holliday junction branch migration protein RuvA [Patescibacteria group bacterium]